METNQLKYSIIYKKIVMRAGHDERIINHKWPKEPFFIITNTKNYHLFDIFRCCMHRSFQKYQMMSCWVMT